MGGVAPPSEIAVGVPNDLDLICRMTLNDDRGPLSPGDLALQIAPWASTQPSSDGGSGIGLAQTRVPVTPHRQLPARPRRRRSAASDAASGTAAGALAGGATAAGAPRGGPASVQPAAPSAKRSGTSSPESARTGADVKGPGAKGPDAKGPDGADPSETGAQKSMAAAGAAASAAAGAIGDRVGSFARAAAEKASAKAAERRAAHALDDDGVEDIHLDEALDEAPATRLEPPVPLPGFGPDTAEAPSKAASRVALVIVAVLVLVALAVGVNNVMKIGQSEPPAAGQTVTLTASGTKPTPSTTSQPPTTAPTTTAPPLAPVTITGGTVLDPQGLESDGKVKLVYDGNPSTVWTSRWYGSADYNGKKDGVGVVLDLDRSVVLTSVELVLPAKQDVTVYAATNASIDGAGTVTLTAPDGLTAATKLIVWVTKAAPAEAPNHYRAQISEVTVG